MSDEDTVRRINTWGVDSPDCAGERAVIYLLPEWVLPAEGHQAAAGQPQQGAAEPDRGDRRREPHEEGLRGRRGHPDGDGPLHP